MNNSTLFHSAGEFATRAAIVDNAGEWTYEALLRGAAQVRDRLLDGRPNLEEERVLFLVPAGFSYVATMYGIWAAGGVAVPLCLKHPLPELVYVRDDTKARQLVYSAEFESLAGQLCTPGRLARHRVEEWTLDSRSVTSPEFLSGDLSRRAMILYTSGSTGRPKGVVTTMANILAQVDALVEAWEWSCEDRILHVLPLHHIHGIINVLLSALRVGASCEFAHLFNPQTVWERIGSAELTLFMAVPTVYARLISAFDEASSASQGRWSEAAKSMRLHVSGSAALPVPVLERWEAITGQRLLERYGMTEIGTLWPQSSPGRDFAVSQWLVGSFTDVLFVSFVVPLHFIRSSMKEASSQALHQEEDRGAGGGCVRLGSESRATEFRRHVGPGCRSVWLDACGHRRRLLRVSRDRIPRL